MESREAYRLDGWYGKAASMSALPSPEDDMHIAAPHHRNHIASASFSIWARHPSQAASVSQRCPMNAHEHQPGGNNRVGIRQNTAANPCPRDPPNRFIYDCLCCAPPCSPSAPAPSNNARSTRDGPTTCGRVWSHTRTLNTPQSKQARLCVCQIPMLASSLRPRA